MLIDAYRFTIKLWTGTTVQRCAMILASVLAVTATAVSPRPAQFAAAAIITAVTLLGLLAARDR